MSSVKANREDYREMVSAMELAGIKPIIDKVFSFEQLKEAYEYSLAGSHFGKIVVKLQ
jgi:NADPH:quinone reductase-like Zn-dependent oxidoreductase